MSQFVYLNGWLLSIFVYLISVCGLFDLNLLKNEIFFIFLKLIKNL